MLNVSYTHNVWNPGTLFQHFTQQYLIRFCLNNWFIKQYGNGQLTEAYVIYDDCILQNKGIIDRIDVNITINGQIHITCEKVQLVPCDATMYDTDQTVQCDNDLRSSKDIRLWQCKGWISNIASYLLHITYIRPPRKCYNNFLKRSCYVL